MSIMTLFGCGGTKAPAYPTDTLTTRDGSPLAITFFKHASLALEVGGKYIYVDPVGANADYAALPKADLVLITHSHADHLDSAAIATLLKPETLIVADSTSAATFAPTINSIALSPGAEALDIENVGINIQPIAAYNTSEGHLQFHPKERQDCGYILTIGGTRIYIAGDSEPTPEMQALTNIDIAFLPVNQPYTMTVDQAVETVKIIRPTIFYPYHYGEVEEKTDINRLARELESVTEVRIRPME